MGGWVPIEHKVAWAEVYLHTMWNLRPSSRLATTDIGRQLGGCPFRGGELCLRLTMSPRLTPASVPSGILIHPAIWPQQIWAKIGGCAPLEEGSWVPI